jgi:5-methylcytosine-specific restriction endonuclease McrA
MRTKEQLNEYQRQWRAKNPDKCAVYSRRWVKKNWEKHLGDVRKWNKANRAKRNVFEGNWKAKNPEKVRAVILKWREANKERYRLITKRARDKWAVTHPAKVRANRHKRREQVRNAKRCDQRGVNVLCQLISDTPKLKCGICGKNMPKNDRTIDHIIPLSKGGSGEIWNLRIVHMLCNAKKHAKMPDELNYA